MTKIDELIYLFRNQIVIKTKVNRIFYFDESNNIRKGIIGKEKDNNEDLQHLCFVLGGIATSKELDFIDLIRFVGGKQLPEDAKFKYFSFGETTFEKSIKQYRLKRFFQYLYEHDVLIHFDVLHYMHFALVDILDSLIEEDDINQRAALMFYKQLQSDMTETLYKNYSLLHSTLVKFGFPNIDKENTTDFINSIYDLYLCGFDSQEHDDLDAFSKELLRQIIKAKKSRKNLKFLEDNKPLVISESVFQNYVSRMAEIGDKKYFDEENTIKEKLESMDSEYHEKLNMDFVKSHDYREIQISDVITGFVGKMYTFLGRNDEMKIKEFVDNLETKALDTLKYFILLMEKSDLENPLLFRKIMPLFIEQRFKVFYIEVCKKTKI